MPDFIVDREKKSFDRGCNLRKEVVSILRDSRSERENLLSIWSKLFPNFNSEDSYFHRYRAFDRFIESRSRT